MCGSSQYSCSRMKASRAAPKLSTTSHRILLDPHLLRYGWTGQVRVLLDNFDGDALGTWRTAGRVRSV